MQPEQDDEIFSPYYPSATRYKLMKGCDRIMLTACFAICVLMVYVWKNFYMLAISIIAMRVSYKLLKLAGLVDPLLRKVYLRALDYAAFYRPEPRIYREPPKPKSNWIKG